MVPLGNIGFGSKTAGAANAGQNAGPVMQEAAGRLMNLERYLKRAQGEISPRRWQSTSTHGLGYGFKRLASQFMGQRLLEFGQSVIHIRHISRSGKG